MKAMLFALGLMLVAAAGMAGEAKTVKPVICLSDSLSYRRAEIRQSSPPAPAAREGPLQAASRCVSASG